MPKGSVKVMRSYDYCHFEVALSSDEDMTLDEIDDMRKDAQRLTDKAVAQYKVAKQVADALVSTEYNRRRLEADVAAIKEMPPSTWTESQKAMVKASADADWRDRYEYDYEDDYVLPDREWNR